MIRHLHEGTEGHTVQMTCDQFLALWEMARARSWQCMTRVQADEALIGDPGWQQEMRFNNALLELFFDEDEASDAPR